MHIVLTMLFPRVSAHALMSTLPQIRTCPRGQNINQVPLEKVASSPPLSLSLVVGILRKPVSIATF